MTDGRPRVGLTLLLATLGLALAPGVHAANELCGQTITESITLTADQSCTGDGLIIGTDGVTIDLGGFTIRGDRDADDVGIDVDDFSHVTIRNGTVENFNIGIRVLGGAVEALKITNVTSRDNVSFGALLVICSGAVTRSSFLANDDEGLVFSAQCAKGAVVDSCAFVGNGGDAGLELGVTSKAKISKVVAAQNAGDGVRLVGTRISLRSSTASANGGHGVFIHQQAVNVAIASNVIIGNHGDGILFDIPNVDPNVVTSNLIAGNAGIGIQLGNEAANIAVVGNRVIGNAIGADIESPGANFVKGNTAVGNRTDGFLTPDLVNTFANNVANANGGRGIVADAIDGGGNTARANAVAACSPAIACPPAFTPKPGPVTPTCGMNVTTSITLGADTPVCAGTNGLIVGVDGVTINLNGHTVRGDGNSVTTGIVIPAGRKHVTIANGRVQGFQVGIGSDVGSDGLKITNVEASGNNLHGALLEGAGAVVSKSVFVDNWGSGLVVDDFATGAKVSASFFVNNAVDGIVLRAPGGSLTNLVSAVNVHAGVHLLSDGDGKLQGGIVAANGGDGVRIEGAFGVSGPSALKKTVIVGNGIDGIVVAGNTVGMLFDSNFSAANGGHGIALMSSPDQMTIKKNALLGNVSDGLFVDVAVQTTAVTQNAATGNGGSGLNVDNTLSTLAKNLAVGNVLSGIRTPSGAIDGGGNKAHDNLALQQCTPPIVCP